MVEELKNEEATLELRRKDVELAESQVKSDQISVQVAEQRLVETKVFAPMDGTVSARAVQTGVIIASAISNVGGGTTVLTLSDLSRIFTLASVDESDIGIVKLEQSVNVTADAYPGRKFKGKVSRIATKGVNVSSVVTFEVQIEILDQKKALLKPEMTTNVEIIAAEKDQALTVPSEAVAFKKGQRLATVQKPDGTTEDRPVTTGINNGDRIEVLTGLAEGETVILRKAESGKGQGNRPGAPGMFPGLPGGGGRPR